MTSALSSESDCPLPSSQLPQNASASFNSIPNVQPMGRLLSLAFGVALPIFLVGIVIVMYMMYKRRQTRRELEGGQCNLPTVVWRPRFMNYTTQDDGTNEDELDWDDDDCIMEWASSFLKEQPDIRGTDITPNKKKKMGSSSITNILPRMKRLNGPYGMYATVYGIQTKVVHVAHPVPARAILTGAGVVEIGGMGEMPGGGRENRDFSFSWQSVLQIFKRTTVNHTDMGQTRRRSSSLRMLTGSTKYPAYDHFKNFSGEGVFTANGSDWKAKRASVMHCLLRNGVTDKSLEMEANRAADYFEREVACAMERNKSQSESKNGSAKEKKSPVMDVVPMLQRSTIGLIYRLITRHDVEFSPESVRDENNGCREKEESTLGRSDSLTSSSPRSSATSLASMGEEAECQNDDATSNGGTSNAPAKYLSHTKHDEKEKQIKSLLSIYLQSVTKIRMIVLAQSRSIWYLLPRWVYRAFSPMYREEERTMVPIRKFAQLACENAVSGSPLALLSQRNSHSSENDERSISANVSKNLLDEAITLLFAGQDTSAATLSWTLHLLSLHPDKQERVANEVRSVLGNVEIKPVLKCMISQMPYLDAVIKESMRLYPVAPFIVRKLTTDITIPIDEELATNQEDTKKSISMPASTFACIWIYALHRNPKLWDRPGEFLPERWIDPELRSRDLGQEEYGSYMPFAIGPRNCLGQPLAQVILRILLSRILNKYVVFDPKLEALQQLSKGGEFDSNCLRKDMQAGFTVLPSNGLKLQLMERI
mmetsp:Transcript_3109/g.6853  ORF Transcript_3109/g.6853 Transcript_3109/m.6853 type:complete len:765 (-) Transcript_3109:54-2348(-)